MAINFSFHIYFLNITNYLDMKEGCSGDIGHRRPDLLPSMNYVDPEGINSISANVIPVHTRYEDLSFMVVDEKATNHGVACTVKSTCNSKTKKLLN